jgi:mRNA-degrading endonuclease toxin of MazEF toxin-antitoxin module
MVGIGHRPPLAGPARGDIHLVAFPERDGAVIAGPHPAVIVSSDRLNRASGTVLVCPMTSKIRHDPKAFLPPYLVSASGRQTGLALDGYVKADQIHTIPFSALGARMGHANVEVIAALDDALRFVLSLPDAR